MLLEYSMWHALNSNVMLYVLRGLNERWGGVRCEVDGPLFWCRRESIILLSA